MSVAIRKIDAVESVNVSLNEGLADVKLKPGNHLDPERIRQVARDNGFTPKGAEVKAVGRIIERNGTLALAVTGLDLVYQLTEAPDTRGKLEEARKLIGKSVVVSGHIPESKVAPPADTPRTFQLRDIAIEVN